MVELAVLVFCGLVLGLVVSALIFLSQARAARDRTDARFRDRPPRYR